MKKAGLYFLAGALIALPASGMAAYEGGDVKDGGTISGTVKFKGTAPAPKKLDVNKDKEVCVFAKVSHNMFFSHTCSEFVNNMG